MHPELTIFRASKSYSWWAYRKGKGRWHNFVLRISRGSVNPHNFIISNRWNARSFHFFNLKKEFFFKQLLIAETVDAVNSGGITEHSPHWWLLTFRVKGKGNCQDSCLEHLVIFISTNRFQTVFKAWTWHFATPWTTRRQNSGYSQCIIHSHWPESTVFPPWNVLRCILI